MRDDFDRITIWFFTDLKPSQHVVRTSILSKQWRNTWCSVPSLNIDRASSVGSKPFCKFVCYFLLLREGKKIENFRLSTGNRTNKYSKKWITYAIRHNVEVLDIKTAELTPLIFTCNTLRVFKYTKGTLNFPSSICLPALKILHLTDVVVGEIDDSLFSAIPCVESFSLENCSFQNHDLSIYSPQLQTLILKGDFPTMITISTPNLVSLVLNPDQDFPDTVRFCSDLNNLLHANIDVDRSCIKSTTRLFDDIKNVRSLTLSSLFLSTLGVELQNMTEDIETPLYNVRRLHVKTAFTNGEIFAIDTILNHSPRIEKIVFDKQWEDHDEYSNYLFPEMWLQSKLLYLKSVEIKIFEESANTLGFIKLLLMNAVVLEKLTITIPDVQEIRRISNNLLAYPRASSSLRLVLMGC